MIIPKRDAKSYGAVHIDYFLTFIGFCKKVSSDEVQSIDVFIDGNKIDTIVCDKTIDKVSQIYDIEGHGFEYDLPEVYFDKRHLLSFRCSDSGEELVNSPISTICKDDEKFNEYKFLNSLSKPIDEDKVIEIDCKNSVGFLAVDDNLNDHDFIEYIKELHNRLPDVLIKAFYFNQQQKDSLNKILNGIIIPVSAVNILDLMCSIEIFIFQNHLSLKYLSLINFLKLSNFSYNRVLAINFSKVLKNREVGFYNNASGGHPYITSYNKFEFVEDEVINCNNNVIRLIYNNLYKISSQHKVVDDGESLYNLYYFERIHLALGNKQVKERLINLDRLLV